MQFALEKEIISKENIKFSINIIWMKVLKYFKLYHCNKIYRQDTNFATISFALFTLFLFASFWCVFNLKKLELKI